jgi:metallophosphoesterase (TIGR00282 family)
MGRVFVGNFDDPFQSVDHYLQSFETGIPLVILVDFHAEATSEKAAMGWYLDGRVSALVGTHTHVATCDHRILPKGTAYVSDLGMVGPMDSIIGSNPTDVLARFLTQMPGRLKVASGDMIRFNSVMIDIDENTGRAEAIERLDRIIEYHER